MKDQSDQKVEKRVDIIIRKKKRVDIIIRLYEAGM